jgi:hypothetical protein
MRFEDKIRCLGLLFDFSITSWIRSKKRNAQIGGVIDSRHLLGLAVDCVLDDGMEKPEFIKHCVNLGLQPIEEGDHIHVQEPRS